MDVRQRQSKLSATYPTTNGTSAAQNRPMQDNPYGENISTLNETQKAAQGSAEKQDYLEMVQLTMRLHARLMSVVKLEMERQSIPLNAVQALLLYHIGEGEITAGELTAREQYLGSNASYNLKKMAEQGWLMNHRSKSDRRAVKIRLSDDGLKIYKIIDGLFERHLAQMKLGKGSSQPLSSGFSNLISGMQDLDRLWHDQILYRL
jgi:DNA-binding MarR family transcriptional regulator